MRAYRFLALVPPLALLGGLRFANHVEPFVLGLPFLLFWIVLWVVATSATMWLIWTLDRRHAARESPHGESTLRDAAE